jgi:hypothetical protein
MAGIPGARRLKDVKNRFQVLTGMKFAYIFAISF